MSETVEALVDIWYPRATDIKRTEDQPQAVVVSLVDVRAADNIRVSYDFERDGWVIQQIPMSGQELDFVEGEWTEVAFIRAWGLDSRE